MTHVQPDRRRLLRMAGLLHERLTREEWPRPAPLPEWLWRECLRISRLQQRAIARRYFLAAERLDRRLHRTISELRESLPRTLPPESQNSQAPTQKELFEELLALHEEFDRIKFDLREETLSVWTEPIVLEGIDLGEFEIRLELKEGDALPGYRVITEEEGWSASRGITHPHVQDERLCAGDGRLPIRLALQQGRLTDFFQIVTQVLGTYNPGSAYVQLSEWDGSPCADCGASVADEDRYSCWKCDCALCSDCERHCTGCLESYCAECVSRCSDCNEDQCQACLRLCAACGERFCRGCLEEGRCETCRESDDEVQDSPAAAQPATCIVQSAGTEREMKGTATP